MQSLLKAIHNFVLGFARKKLQKYSSRVTNDERELERKDILLHIFHSSTDRDNQKKLLVLQQLSGTDPEF